MRRKSDKLEAGIKLSGGGNATRVVKVTTILLHLFSTCIVSKKFNTIQIAKLNLI